MFTFENSIVVVDALESRTLCSATFASVEAEFEHAGLPQFARQPAIHVDGGPALNRSSLTTDAGFLSPMKRGPRQVTNVVGTWVGTYRIGKSKDGGSVQIVITSQSKKQVTGTIIIDGEALSGSARFSVDKKGNFVAKDSGDGWSAKLTGKLNRNATAATGKWSFSEAGEKTLKGTFHLHRV